MRREIEPVTAADLWRFLACWHHATESTRLDGPRGVLEVVRQLAGFEIPAARWESSVLPARVRDYRPDWLEPLLTELEESGRFLFVHPSASNPPAGAPRWWRGLFDFTAEMQSAYGAWLVWHGPAHPTLKVLFTILGGGAPFQIERLGSRGIAEETLRSENLFFDTASYGERAIALARDACGRGQIVYGSDLPVIDSTPTLEAVRSLGLHEALDANPARLLAA